MTKETDRSHIKSAQRFLVVFCLDLLRFRFEIRLVGCLSDAENCVIPFERFCGLDPEPYGIKRRKKDKREDRANGGSANEGVRQGSPKSGERKGNESEHGSECRENDGS